MRCPTLADLFPPPSGKVGWPWTEESLQLHSTMPDGHSWPQISIITPSYNQGQFIEATIRSVLLQGYPNLEYIIIDGGSNDNSLDIIQKYEPWLAYWVSEPDKGQSHAINKALARSTGKIAAWLNSDDLYLPGALASVARLMWRDGQVVYPIVHGNCDVIDETGNVIDKWIGKPVDRDKMVAYWRWNWEEDWCIIQPAVFFSGNIFRANLLNESLHLVMDRELFIRLSEKYNFYHCSQTLASFRLYKYSKTQQSMKQQSGNTRLKELDRVSRRYWLPGLRRYLTFWLDYKSYYFIEKIKITLRQVLGARAYKILKTLKNTCIGNLHVW